MRTKGDKKGGLMILYKKDSDIEMKKIETKHKDILNNGNLNFNFILLYLATNDTPRSE